MASRIVGRLLVYPVVLLCGVALGTDFGSKAPLYPSGPPPQNREPGSFPLDGRLGAESAELRVLRQAERQLFPELSGLDPDARLAAEWDPPSTPAATSFEGQLGPVGDFLANLAKPDLPIRRHPRVLRYIKYFSKSAEGRKLFAAWLKRSGHYRVLIEDELRSRGLPLDLQAVVFVESGFWPTARSTAGAVGLWQFMPRTARAYGLVVDGNYDERRSIWRSTEAAAKHLEDLHDHFRSWDLALASYNYGHDNVSRRMKDLGARDFWELSAIEGGLPRETVLYVPKVLAIAVLLRNLEHYGFSDAEIAEPFEAAAIKVPPRVRLSLIARAAGTSTRMMRDLNPEVREDTIPDRGGPAIVRIPRNGLARARAMLPQLLQQSGDSGLDLAASLDFDWGEDEFGTDGRSPLDRLSGKPKAASAGKEPSQAKPAARPQAKPSSVPPARPTTRSKPTRSKPKSKTRPERQRIVHRVEFGDTVYDLALTYGVSSAHIIRTNKLSNPDALIIGSRLVLHVPVTKKQHGKAPRTPDVQ